MNRFVAATVWALTAHTALNARLLRDPPPAGAVVCPADGPAGARPRVSVLVPARDEDARIGACLAALRDSVGFADGALEIVVLDDRSTDGTTTVVRAVERVDDRVRLLEGGDPPPGWLGKPHACAQLAAAAAGDVLVFVDADVLVARDGIVRTVAALEHGPLDLTCPYPLQVVDGPATRLLQPLLQWSWLTFLPLRVAERARRPSLVAANGQLLACRARDYARAGGHAAVRDAVLEDLELGRAFTRAGLRAGVVAGHELATCTMYHDWSEVRAGYTKSLWAALGAPPVAAVVAATLLALYVAPPAVLTARLLRGVRGSRTTAAVVATVGGILGRVISARRTGGAVADAVAHPVSVLLLVRLVVESHVARRRGRLTWKGRAVTPPGADR